MPSLHAQFDDIDPLCELVQGWDLDLVQLDRGPFEGDLLQFGGSTAAVTFARFERKLEQRGGPPGDSWTFAVPLDDCRPLYWHGADARAGDVVIFPPEWGLQAVSFGAFHVATMSVSEETMLEIAEREGLALSLGNHGGWVVRRSLRALAPLLRELSSLDGALRVAATDQAREMDARVRAAIVPELVRALAAPERELPGTRAPARREALARALEVVDDAGEEPLSVAQLCAASGTSLRTLHRAFLERFDVSPKAYLQSRRLNAVQRLLLRADPARTRVADVAGAQGFWHMGKLAADYRRHFGELPSETLRRSGSARNDADSVQRSR